MDVVVEKSEAKLWIHGHTHDNMEYSIDKTQVICNPRGYAHEVNPAFNPQLIMEL